jgi:hypothetical protein
MLTDWTFQPGPAPAVIFFAPLLTARPAVFLAFSKGVTRQQDMKKTKRTETSA